ncbi:hypothetical protein TNCV_2820951 [Trichonephila clavipes]|nr:hypothetical protein TNCV_2820951 [Trichonephila clavipes]
MLRQWKVSYQGTFTTEPVNVSYLLLHVSEVHFLKNIRKSDFRGFQMTSFGATNIVRGNYMPTSSVHCSYEQYECFYLLLLLINIRGPISSRFKNANGQLCATYRQTPKN